MLWGSNTPGVQPIETRTSFTPSATEDAIALSRPADAVPHTQLQPSEASVPGQHLLVSEAAN